MRGLENLKVFEMPLLGFLGFPMLAFDCLTGFAFISYWQFGNTTWEAAIDLSVPLRPRPRVSRSVFIGTIPLHFFFWLAVSAIGVPINVASLQLELEDYLSDQEVQTLAGLQIERPRQLLRGLHDPQKSPAITATLGWTRSHRDRIVEQTRLLTFKGIGAAHGRLLQAAGVTRLDDLPGWNPRELHTRLEALAVRQGLRPPRLDMVRVWILASRDQGVVQHHPSHDDH